MNFQGIYMQHTRIAIGRWNAFVSRWIKIPTGKCDNCMRTLQMDSALASWFAFSLTLFFDTLHQGALHTGSCNIHSNFCLILGSWSNDDGHVKENGKRGNRFKVAKQQPYTCITPFCTFLCRHSATTMWKCLISRFVEDMNARQRSSFSFCELRYSPLELNSWKNRQHMTN